MAKFKIDILWLLAGVLVGASGMDLYWHYGISFVCSRAFKASNNLLVALVHGGPSESEAIAFVVGLTGLVRWCASSCVLTAPSAQTRLPAFVLRG
jgi:hypothetical protein